MIANQKAAPDKPLRSFRFGRDIARVFAQTKSRRGVCVKLAAIMVRLAWSSQAGEEDWREAWAERVSIGDESSHFPNSYGGKRTQRPAASGQWEKALARLTRWEVPFQDGNEISEMSERAK